MTEQLKEALSAVVDGEADVFELRRVLDEVGRSDELTGAWRRYHLIGERLRGEASPLDDQAVSAMGDAIWASLGDEPTEVPAAPAALLSKVPSAEPEASPGTAPWKRIAPFAVAASVAAAVMLGLGGTGTDSAQPLVAQGAIEIEGPIVQLESDVSPSDVQRANAYMLHHVQQKALNNPGVASFVKVVTFENAEPSR
jgi:sigma-E factor negative regulatory protein RseA